VAVRQARPRRKQQISKGYQALRKSANTLNGSGTQRGVETINLLVRSNVRRDDRNRVQLPKYKGRVSDWESNGAGWPFSGHLEPGQNNH